MTLYDSIGENYSVTRKPDPRIVARLINLLNLPQGSTIADLGAGTGNYSRAIADAGYEVLAIEPSAVMRNQAIPHGRVSWIAGLATFPSTQKIARSIAQISQKEVGIIPYLLPPDLSDLFAASGWCQPKIYLNEQVRQGISSFVKMPVNELETGLNRLQADLNQGVWTKKYGYLLAQGEYDAGYRIIVTK